jgi:hypothetical protein
MGASVVAYWPGITGEQMDEQPGFWNDCKAWGDFMAEREDEPDVLRIIGELGAAPLLTVTTDGMEDDEVAWVTPRQLYQAAEHLQAAIRAQQPGTEHVLAVYARHANSINPVEEEFAQDLEDIKALAQWAEKEGAPRMTLAVNW